MTVNTCWESYCSHNKCAELYWVQQFDGHKSVGSEMLGDNLLMHVVATYIKYTGDSETLVGHGIAVIRESG